MKIKVFGAAGGEVTGSTYLIDAARALGLTACAVVGLILAMWSTIGARSISSSTPAS